MAGLAGRPYVMEDGSAGLDPLASLVFQGNPEVARRAEPRGQLLPGPGARVRLRPMWERVWAGEGFEPTSQPGPILDSQTQIVQLLSLYKREAEALQQAATGEWPRA